MGLCLSSSPLPVNPQQIDLSHFTLGRVLGRGGFGKVHAAHAVGNDTLFVAIKSVAKHKLIAHEQSLLTVQMERRVMTEHTLNQPFLLSALHCFQSADHLYMVMPLMRGGDLRYYIRHHNVTESAAKFYMSELAVALRHLHNRRIVMRDIKPDNILLDETGHIRLSDFGLCAQIGIDGAGIRGLCGTVGYIAPEARAMQRYDYSVDFYAYGVVLFELLHRALPSDEQYAHSSHAVLAQRISPHISDECRDILFALLESNPRKRLCDWTALQSHRWFSNIDWDRVTSRSLTPPFVPNAAVANCDPVYELEEQILVTHSPQVQLTTLDQAKFVGWEWRVNISKDGRVLHENAVEDDGKDDYQDERGGLSVDKIIVKNEQSNGGGVRNVISVSPHHAPPDASAMVNGADGDVIVYNKR